MIVARKTLVEEEPHTVSDASDCYKEPEEVSSNAWEVEQLDGQEDPYGSSSREEEPQENPQYPFKELMISWSK